MNKRSPHKEHETHQSWCIACQREAKAELDEKGRREDTGGEPTP